MATRRLERVKVLCYESMHQALGPVLIALIHTIKQVSSKNAVTRMALILLDRRVNEQARRTDAADWSAVLIPVRASAVVSIRKWSALDVLPVACPAVLTRVVLASRRIYQVNSNQHNFVVVDGFGYVRIKFPPD